MNDEDINNSIRQKLQQQRPEERNLVDLRKYINDELIPQKVGVPGAISISTLWKYMCEWGYLYRKFGKDIFFDGHERPDVIEYRKAWALRMLQYKSFMTAFGEEDEVIEPVLADPSQQKLVLVTHDECTFYANDGKKDMWLLDGDNPLRKKGPGASIMVSEFQCPCHGTMRIQSWTSRRTICAGANRDGYWKSEDMVKQLVDDAIPLFESLHSNCKAVFVFDQSSNHNAFSKDGLVASRLVLKDKVVANDHQYAFRNTTFLLDGREYPQAMYRTVPEVVESRKGKRVAKDIKYVKGIKTILEERGLWMDEDPYRRGRSWRLDCASDQAVDHRCCARHLLAAQPDFLAQKSALCEVIERAGHIFELYPKFHCECNWIERYWGAAKREARIRCDYTFNSLKSNLDEFLDNAGNVSSIRRYYNRCWR